jgi:SAM-dependent methyltransferase
MKISELINYLRGIEDQSLEDMQAHHRLRMQDLYLATCFHPNIKLESWLDRMDSRRQAFSDLYSTLNQDLVDLRQEIHNLIQQQSHQYLKQCEDQWLQKDREFEQSAQVLGRTLDLKQDQRDQLRSLILKHQDWRWPGMIIRPAHEDFINDMVSFDPLYLVDVNTELLQPALDRFNPVYRSRLCSYQVQEQHQENFLAQLPQTQFGLIFAYNFFEYRPMVIIEAWFRNILQLLQPGGQLIFTYNDCDRPSGISVCERGFMTYSPCSEIMIMSQRLGFEILDQSHDSEIAWMQLAKPGNKISLRGSQTLAKVIAQPK